MEDQAFVELLDVIESNKQYQADQRYVFLKENGDKNQRAYGIGVQLQMSGGDTSMHNVMNRLMCVVENEIDIGKDYLVFDLRQLECCWNGIGGWMC